MTDCGAIQKDFITFWFSCMHDCITSVAVAAQACKVTAVIYFPWSEDTELWRWSCIRRVFGLPPDHSTLGLITKTSILVWSWSHSVRTLMRNMWSCPDTQSEETKSLVPCFTSPFPSPFPPFFLHFFPFTIVFTWVAILFCSSSVVFMCLSLTLFPQTCCCIPHILLIFNFQWNANWSTVSSWNIGLYFTWDIPLFFT